MMYNHLPLRNRTKMKEKRNIVWLKRDLRIQDHQPFLDAENAEDEYLSIYIFEPSLISYPDSSLRHLQFTYHSILEMNKKLKKYNREVIIYNAESIDVFKQLSQEFDLKTVFSYQETGILKTWKRDKEISKLLKDCNVSWKEFQRDGIVRGIKNRLNWDNQWFSYIKQDITTNYYTHYNGEKIKSKFNLNKSLDIELRQYPVLFQKPGEVFAWKYLKSFCNNRGKNYSIHISKPKESRRSCGRISPYLAFGNISIKQVYHHVAQHSNYNFNKRSFNGLLTRLKWNNHFIQKFESECDYETRCVNRGFEKLSYSNNESLIKAWKKGLTGFPLVDACMRCLIATGWINFRMRAMLVSVFCLHFDCDWRKGVYHLANLFLDYEPGIHYTQFQMQAGTTGINTIRMYNPIKQSKDHDPDGLFIKEWVTELEFIPQEFIHEPWRMTELDKEFNNVKLDYPKPVIDLVKAGKIAREKIWGHRKDPIVKKENNRILNLHVRRKSTKNFI